jgi:hypothetical protein
MLNVRALIYLAGFIAAALPVSGQVQPLAPETFSLRMLDFGVATVGPQALVLPAAEAGIRTLSPPADYPPAWRRGPGGFGRQYGAALADRASKETARAVTAAILREDFRYRPSASKNVFARTFHAVGYTFIDRSDSGGHRLAVANFAGAAAGGFVGEYYLPRGYNDASHARTRVAFALGEIAGRYILKEFTPELRRAAVKLHLEHSIISVPEWWVKLPTQ